MLERRKRVVVNVLEAAVANRITSFSRTRSATIHRLLLYRRVRVDRMERGFVHVGSRPKERGWEWKYVPRVVDLEVWKGEVVTSERGFATLASFKTCGLVASKEGPPTSTKTQGKAGTD